MALIMNSLQLSPYAMSASYTPAQNLPLTPRLVPEPVPVAAKVATYIESLRQKMTGVELRPLEALIDHVTIHGVSGIEYALTKPSGYFWRLFTQESWPAWCDNKTPLGRVISRLSDCIQSSGSAQTLIDRFEQKELLTANREAATVLRRINKEPQVFPARVFLSKVANPNGIVFQGSAGESFGSSVGGVGDINNDGKKDLFITSSSNGYIIFGDKIHSSPFQVKNLDGTNGCKIIVT